MDPETQVDLVMEDVALVIRFVRKTADAPTIGGTLMAGESALIRGQFDTKYISGLVLGARK